MSDDRIAGTARSFGGKVQEGVGKATGDTKTEVKGAMNQAAGAVQDAYGKTVDALWKAPRPSKRPPLKAMMLFVSSSKTILILPQPLRSGSAF